MPDTYYCNNRTSPNLLLLKSREVRTLLFAIILPIKFVAFNPHPAILNVRKFALALDVKTVNKHFAPSEPMGFNRKSKYDNLHSGREIAYAKPFTPLDPRKHI